MINKDELIRWLDERIMDYNYYINSKMGDDIQKKCWEYAREMLIIIKNKVDNM